MRKKSRAETSVRDFGQVILSHYSTEEKILIVLQCLGFWFGMLVKVEFGDGILFLKVENENSKIYCVIPDH